MSEAISPAERAKKPLPAVMIVDDDTNVRFFLRSYLRSRGITELLEATNGQEAVDQMKTRPDIGMVITDLKMPVMDGVEVVRQLRQLKPSLNIVVLTGYPEYEGIAETAKHWAMFVMKPIELTDLDRILDTYVFGAH